MSQKLRVCASRICNATFGFSKFNVSLPLVAYCQKSSLFVARNNALQTSVLQCVISQLHLLIKFFFDLVIRPANTHIKPSNRATKTLRPLRFTTHSQCLTNL